MNNNISMINNTMGGNNSDLISDLVFKGSNLNLSNVNKLPFNGKQVNQIQNDTTMSNNSNSLQS